MTVQEGKANTQFGVAGARTVLAVVKLGFTAQQVLDLAEMHHQRADVAVERLMKKDNPYQVSLPVCAEGCAHCCYQSVPVCGPEAIWIADFVRKTTPPEGLDRVRAAMRDAIARNEAHGDRAVHRDNRCAFLEEKSQSCTIHPVRPGPCRAFNSVDVAMCIAAFTGETGENMVELNPIQHRNLQQAWLGMMAGLKMAGLEYRVVDIASATLLLLDHPEAAEQWRRGEHVFAAVENARMKVVNASYAPILERIIQDTKLAESGKAGPVGPTGPSAEVAKGLVKRPKGERKKR